MSYHKNNLKACRFFSQKYGLICILAGLLIQPASAFFWNQEEPKQEPPVQQEAVQPKKTQNGQKILDRANQFYLQGSYARAMLLYRKAEKRGADPVACAFNTGNSYFQLNKLPEAAAAFRKAVHLSRGHFAPALFNMAAVLYRLGQYPESIAAYHRALRLQDDNVSAWLYLAEAYSRTGDVVGAQKALENAKRLDPEDISIVYQLAEVHMNMQEVDQAASLVRAAFARHPEETDFLIYLGDIYRASNRLNEATAAWREALAIEPENTELLYKIADALAENNQAFLAMDYLQKALSIRPEFSDASIFLGNLAFDAQWWDRAETAYLQAAQSGNPEALHGFRNLAYEFDQRQMPERSLEYLVKASKFYPEEASLRNEIDQYRSQMN